MNYLKQLIFMYFYSPPPPPQVFRLEPAQGGASGGFQENQGGFQGNQGGFG